MDTAIKESDSEFVRHIPCENPECGSSDANSLYDDGHTHCFSCGTTVQPDSTSEQPKQTMLKSPLNQGLITGVYQDLVKRKLNKDVCRKFGYFKATHKGEPVQVANYVGKDGTVVAQKVRTKDKGFSILGDAKKMSLFGSHLWAKGKMLVICEGELDTISAHVCLGKYHAATVGIPNGSNSAVRAIKDNYDYVSGFDKCVICFDADDAGRKAATEAAQMLPVGKAFISHLPLKDVNDCLVAGKSAAVVSAIFEAKEYRPDSIVAAADLRSVIGQDDAASSIKYPYDQLNAITGGIRRGELVTITAGSGMGKTTLVREIAYKLHQSGEKLGLLCLEETNKRTLLGLVGTHLNKNITVDRSQSTPEEIEATFDELFPEDRQVYLYDHFGSCDIDTIIQRISFMVKALGVTVVVLDHISILISGLATNDERKLIDVAMTRLRTEVVQELGVALIIVSHLRRPSGDKGFEKGEKPTLQSLRGSHSIAQLSDMCLSMAVPAETPDSDIRILSVLKNRWSGQTGWAGNIQFNRDTGRLVEEGSEF
jgi:twinkle protein